MSRKKYVAPRQIVTMGPLLYRCPACNWTSPFASKPRYGEVYCPQCGMNNKKVEMRP
jgi:predicted RNA-binding Zn-ribbon protein involved in translation (DUF1610 family)